MKNIVVILSIFLALTAPARAQWLSGWSSRETLAVFNPSGEELADYPVRVTLDSAFAFEDAGEDGRDIRFTSVDGTTLIPFWVEEWNPENEKAGFWVRIPAIPPGGTNVYLYYGNPAAVSASDGAATFDLYDGFEDPDAINPGVWTRYSGNPLITEGASGEWDDHGSTFASVMWDESAGEFRMYYHGFAYSGAHQIGLATAPSPEGPWTKYSGNPIVTPGPESWDSHSVRVPMVWKEDTTYHMVYTGYNGSAYQIGYATSSDGIDWTKYEGNPVFNDPAWANNETENWGVIKVGEEYLMWYCDFGMRQSGIAVSTDLVNWTPYQTEPIFASSGDTNDDRYSQYCPFTFKYADQYYVLVPSYNGSWNYSKYYLYRSSSPYFPESDRHLVRIAHTVAPEGEWDDHDNDTPFVFTFDVQRSLFYNDELWCFYSAEGGINHWKEGLLIETDIEAALADAPLPGEDGWVASGVIDIVDTPVHSDSLSVHHYDDFTSGATTITRFFSQKESGAVEAWMRRDSTSNGDYDIYLYQDSTDAGDSALACVAGLGRDGDFHYWDGDFHPTGVLWDVDRWYLVTIAFDAAAAGYTFMVHDTTLAELVRVEDIPFGSAAEYIDKAMLYTSMGYLGNCYADDFRIRPWCGSRMEGAIVVAVEEEDIPAASSVLHQNHPNPFNPSTTIRYHLFKDCRVSLIVYNSLGQKVATLVDGHRKAGPGMARWNGRDDSGREAASGIYLYRLKAGSFSEARKMILLR